MTMADAALGPRAASHVGAATNGQAPTSAPARRTVQVTRVQVNAAKLRLVTDRKQGKISPAWVEKLAATGPAPVTVGAPHH